MGLLYYVGVRMNNIAKTELDKGRDQAAEKLPTWLHLVREHVGSLKYGTVQITVHSSRVVQVERVEKLRFDKPEQSGG